MPQTSDKRLYPLSLPNRGPRNTSGVTEGLGAGSSSDERRPPHDRAARNQAVTAFDRAAKLLRSFCTLGGITAMQ